mmetsp:Transcript_35995/g.47478  ORF Transcript_35995/g.47478 Transcript_35995/m.47478 type:complete len:382 (-) Transcript_35995:214-1359(-)
MLQAEEDDSSPEAVDCQCPSFGFQGLTHTPPISERDEKPKIQKSKISSMKFSKPIPPWRGLFEDKNQQSRQAQGTQHPSSPSPSQLPAANSNSPPQSQSQPSQTALETSANPKRQLAAPKVPQQASSDENAVSMEATHEQEVPYAAHAKAAAVATPPSSNARSGNRGLMGFGRRKTSTPKSGTPKSRPSTNKKRENSTSGVQEGGITMPHPDFKGSPQQLLPKNLSPRPRPNYIPGIKSNANKNEGMTREPSCTASEVESEIETPKTPQRRDMHRLQSPPKASGLFGSTWPSNKTPKKKNKSAQDDSSEKLPIMIPLNSKSKIPIENSFGTATPSLNNNSKQIPAQKPTPPEKKPTRRSPGVSARKKREEMLTLNMTKVAV